MFRREKQFVIGFSPAEKKLVRYCLMELRNKLLAASLDNILKNPYFLTRRSQGFRYLISPLPPHCPPEAKNE